MMRASYPRVTTILNAKSKSGLEIWSVKEAFKKYKRLIDEGMTFDEAYAQAKGAANEIKMNAARRGTAVHHLIEGKSREELTIEEGDWDSVGPMYESFELWKKDRNFTAIANEVPVWSDKHGFKGTLDCIGWVDGRLELLDWKSSNHMGLDYRMQVAAYWYGLKESADPEFMEEYGSKLQGIRIVRFGGRSDKESQIKDLVQYEELIVDGEEEISIDFNAFLACKRLYDWDLKRK